MTDPIVQTLELATTAHHAFDAYAAIGTWWDPQYTRDAKTLRSVTIEPRVGGRVVAHHADGDDDWGEVTRWDPPRALAYTTNLAQDGAAPSTIELTFVSTGDRTIVRFEHGGWTAANAHVSEKFRDWSKLLARFAAHAQR
ncbi:MAG TPA: SRPBCC domain-containing protein [Kofleriaceae bacterium]